MKTVFSLCLIFLAYFVILWFKTPEIFSYKFDKILIPRYFLSQDIPHEVNGKRLFLSDSDIHIASGYLYAQGYDPSTINFQHPPLIKYLYGLFIIFFGNPLYVQVIFGMMLLVCTYLMGNVVIGKEPVGLLAAIFLALDPVLISLSKTALLDLGQAVFLTAFVIFSLKKKPSILLSGLFLGLASGSKFWAGSAFMMIIVIAYLMQSKRFILKSFVSQLFVATITFCLIYLPTFIIHRGLFNLIFFELKTIKYWFNHSVTSILGASLILFLTGSFKSWWGHKEWMRAGDWSILYPASLLVSVINYRKFIAIIPILYLLYLGIQAPFSRYFIVILPYVYLTLSDFILNLIVFPSGKNAR